MITARRIVSLSLLKSEYSMSVACFKVAQMLNGLVGQDNLGRANKLNRNGSHCNKVNVSLYKYSQTEISVTTNICIAC